MLEKLTEKIGPLPAWVWGLILGAVILAVVLWQRSNAANAAPASATTSSTALPDVSSDPLQAAGGGSSGSSSDTSGTWSTNALWLSTALTSLAGAGISPLTAEVALENYLNGVALTQAQQKIVNMVLTKLGSPPEGVSGTPILIPPTPPKTTVPTPPTRKPSPPGEVVKPIHNPPVGVIHKPKPTAPKSRTHTVAKGETLSSIAQRYYGKSNPALWEKIAKANHITNVNHIKVGEHLVIPA